jgi:hypothetical protein
VAVTFDGFTIDDADAATGWTGGANDTDSEIQGTGCYGGKVSGGTTDFVYTIQGGDPVSSFDFSATGTHFGNHIYVWLNCLTPTLDLKSNGGLAIIVGDGTNQAAWYVGGDGTEADDPYRGGWFNFIIDPSRDFDEIISGTWTLGGNPAQLTAVTEFGGRVSTVATIMGNFFNGLIDVVRVGKGLILTGGDETDPHNMDVLIASDEGTKNNRYGVLATRSGVIFIKGAITVGDGTTLTYFDDQSQVMVWEDTPVATDFHKWVQEDNANVRWGTITGSGSSRIGANGALMIAAAASAPLTVDLDSGSVTDIDRKEYGGCTFRTNGGGMELGEGGQVISAVFDGCGEVGENGAEIVNSTIQNSNALSTEGALRIDGNGSNLVNLTFNSNDRATRLNTQGDRTYTNFNFSGNNIDVLNDSGDELTVVVSGGGNASSVENATTDSETTIDNQITLTVTNIAANSEIRILAAGTSTELDGSENVTGGTFAYSYNYVASTFVDIIVHHVTDYQWLKVANYELEAGDTNLQVNQLPERNYDNP